MQECDAEQIFGPLDFRSISEELAAGDRRSSSSEKGFNPRASDWVRTPMDVYIDITLREVRRWKTDRYLVIKVRKIGLKAMHSR
jgi:hypothetical protein